MFRLFLSISIVLGMVFVFVTDHGMSLRARGEYPMSSFGTTQDRFASLVHRKNAEIVPYVSENRGQATGFQPVKKNGTGIMAVPTAHASVIVDVESATVLYEHNAMEKRPIASLTKMLTAVIVVERISNLDELVTIDEEAVYAEGTRIGCPRSGYCVSERLRVGEQLSVRDLLKASLMNSANDAAIALGKHLGGSQEGFARLMNARARELGLTHSHFCTPSGLEIDGRENECYSSAYDIARITAHALQYDALWDIMRLEEETIVSADGTYRHELFNTDELLGQFPNLLGTKTGFTPLAGRSLLAVAADPTRRHPVVAVVLDDQYRWQSIRSMLEWSFASFDWQ